MIHAPTDSARLTEALRYAPHHLRPIILAVRDNRCGLMMVGQSVEPFRLPKDAKRTAIVIVGDDMHVALGPDGFHQPSVRRLIRACDAFAIVSCEAMPEVYATAAATAAHMRRNFMLVETRPAQEIAWANLIRKLSPGAPLIMAVVEGGHA